MVLKLFFALLIVSIANCGKLPIQAHSFNDFNYLQNLINKGVDYFKLDVSMANRKSCEGFSTWNKSKKCYRSPQYVEQICCLAFRGDASSRPSFNYQFNTSEEYITFMTNNLAKIVTYQPKRRLLFAINFQYDHSFNDFLTQEFLVALADLMNKYPHNLLLGTGSDNFILQYDRICYGKGAPECTDNRRKISKSNLFLQSGAHNPFDPRDYYKRFRNYNIYYKGIENHCQNGFPQWIKNYPQFPMIFWEPSNEKQIQYVLEQFLSPSCMRKHGRNLSGMAIATNIDIQMFDIYSKKLTQPKMQLHLQVDDSSASPAFQYLNEKLFITEQQSLRITKQAQGQAEIIFSASVNAYLTNKLTLQRWQSDQKTKTIKLVASREHSSVVKQGEKLQSIMNDGIGHIILITENQVKNQSNNIYFFSNTTFELISFKSWAKIYGSYMKKDELIYITCQDSTLANCSIKGAIEFKQTKTYATFFVSSFLSKITSLQEYDDGFIVVGQSTSQSGLAAALIVRQGSVFPPQIPLSFGTDAKIFKKQSGKQFGVLLSNAMCHSALLINNNDMNKCNFFQSPQFSSLKNVRGIVNLIEFDIADLLKNGQIVSPCTPKISLSKIMNGGNSDIIEMPSLGSYLVTSQYIRIEDQDMVAALFCGGSNFDKSFKYRQKSSIMATFNLSNQQDKAVSKLQQH